MDTGDLVCDGLGVRAFIVTGLGEADGVGVDPLASAGDRARGRGHEQRRVEATAREHAQGDIRHQLALHGPQQRLAQLGGVAGRQRRRPAGRLRRAPIAADLDAVAGRNQQGSRRQFVNAVEHRVRRGDVAQGVVERQRLPVEPAGLVGELEQRLDFRGEA